MKIVRKKKKNVAEEATFPEDDKPLF